MSPCMRIKTSIQALWLQQLKSTPFYKRTFFSHTGWPLVLIISTIRGGYCTCFFHRVSHPLLAGLLSTGFWSETQRQRSWGAGRGRAAARTLVTVAVGPADGPRREPVEAPGCSSPIRVPAVVVVPQATVWVLLNVIGELCPAEALCPGLRHRQ